MRVLTTILKRVGKAKVNSLESRMMTKGGAIEFRTLRKIMSASKVTKDTAKANHIFLSAINRMASDDQDLSLKIDEWLSLDKNVTTLSEIESLKRDGKRDELRSRLMTRLAFGTAGLRGVMRAGYNGMNELVVIQTAQGLLKYVQKCFPDAKDQQRGVVFGFDGRYQSKRFAELSAVVFLEAKIPVYLYGKTVATPMVPFAVLEKNCLTGVMVTASHNPKEDNGYKVYWSNGAQIIPPHDKDIQASILDNLTPWEKSWSQIGEYSQSGILFDPFEEMNELYFSKLLNYVPKSFREEFNSKCDLRFVYSAMHGVGYPFVEHGFKVASLNPLVVVKEQRDPDPEFPTVKYPNPEEGKSSLELSMKLANEENCTIILANDPDADRLACAEKVPGIGWKVFSGNELGALLGWWAIFCHKEQNPQEPVSDCYVLASTVSSKMLRSIAKIEGLNFVETLTGFKWMGNRSVELMEKGKKILFAFEEAIGFMVSPNVLDKDGVSAAVHLATMASYLKEKANQTIYEKLQELYKDYGFHYTLISYFLCYDPVLINKIFERIRNYNGEGLYPQQLGDFKIKYWRDLTTGVDNEQPDGKAILPTSKGSQMITFTFENGTIITLRTSGTEPKIKYYSEICATPEDKDWDALKQTLEETVSLVVNELLQPELNKLIPKSD